MSDRPRNSLDHSDPPSQHFHSPKKPSGHIRTLSSNEDNLQAFRGSAAHRRTISNSDVDFHRILAPSPSSEPRKTAENRGFGTDKTDRREDDMIALDSLGEEEEPKLRGNSLRKKRGFLGTLKAAITYFQSDPEPVSLPFSSRRSTYDPEIQELTETAAALQEKVDFLETENARLRGEGERLNLQRDKFVLDIGSLNAQLIDLQLVLKEAPQRSEKPRKAVSSREDSGSLDLSEIKRFPASKPELKSGKMPEIGKEKHRTDFGDGERPSLKWKTGTPAVAKTAGGGRMEGKRSNEGIYFS